ncbi:MAG: hypothetical protein AAFX94_00485, partial [Myxococcota bacterium]
MRRLFKLVVAAALLASCAQRTGVQTLLAERMLDSLSTHGASSVCDPSNPSAPRVAVRSEWLLAMSKGLFELKDAEAAVKPWTECVRIVLQSRPESVLSGASGSLLLALQDALDSRRRRKHVNGLEALRAAFLATRFGSGLEGLAELSTQALRKRRRKAEAPVAAAYDRWLATLEVVRGQRQGVPITSTVIETTEDLSELDVLERFLPTAGLRLVAARRIVVLRLAASPYPELMGVQDDVVEAVLSTGSFRPDLEVFPPLALRVADGILPETLRLHPEGNFQRYAISPGNGQDSVVLAPALRIELSGLATPVVVCGAPARLDPTPCVDVTELQSELGRWSGGDFYPATKLRPKAAIELASAETFEISFTVAGRSLSLGRLPLRLAVPMPMDFTGVEAGGKGPELLVGISRPADEFFFVSVSANETEHFALVPAIEIFHYEVMSRGVDGRAGADGQPGTPGFRGSDGRDASCPDTRGTDGS